MIVYEWKRNFLEKVIFSLLVYENVKYLDIRIYECRGKDHDEWTATQAGLRISLADAENLRIGIEKVLSHVFYLDRQKGDSKDE